jgi:hypothetical protein
MTWPPAQPNQPTPDGEPGVSGVPGIPGEPGTQPPAHDLWARPAADDTGAQQPVGTSPATEAWGGQETHPAGPWAEQTAAYPAPGAASQQQTSVYPRAAEAWSRRPEGNLPVTDQGFGLRPEGNLSVTDQGFGLRPDANPPADPWVQQTAAYPSAGAWGQRYTADQQAAAGYLGAAASAPADFGQPNAAPANPSGAYPGAGVSFFGPPHPGTNPDASYPGAPYPDTLYAGAGAPSGARHPVPQKRRTGLLVGAVAGVLMLGGGAFGVTKLAGSLTSDTTNTTAQPAASTPAAPAAPAATSSDVPTTSVGPSTPQLAPGQTLVTDKADGLSLVLPKGWTQAPTDPKQLVAWFKRAKAKNPNLKAMSPQQLSKLGANMVVLAVYTGARSPQEIEYFTVRRAPVKLPPITAAAIPELQAGLAKDRNMQNAKCRLTTIAGANAAVASVSSRVSTPAGVVKVYGNMYFVNSPAVNGFLTLFFRSSAADPRGDIATVMGSFNPNYTD